MPFRAVQTYLKAQEHGLQGQAPPAVAQYLSLNPLGLAIFLSLPKAELEKRKLTPLLENSGAVYTEPRRSVVLIDEIDKAPRDFPNDILNEIESMYFRIPELAGEADTKPIYAEASMRPVTVLTSNSEKHLPEPFLRRCVYYHIPFPDEKQMALILRGYAWDLENRVSGFFKDVLDFFYFCRAQNLRKPPSTAELLAWLRLLRDVLKEELQHDGCRLKPHREKLKKTLGVLVKMKEDQEIMGEALKQWQPA